MEKPPFVDVRSVSERYRASYVALQEGIWKFRV